MLRVHIISDHFMPPSLLAIERPLPGRPMMPGPGTIDPQPSDTPGLVPGVESPMPGTDTPGLPGYLPPLTPASPGPVSPAPGDDPAPRPNQPDPGDVPSPGDPLPGGGVTVPQEEVPDSPLPLIPVPA